MRGLRGSAAILAAGILAGVAACGSGSAAAFQPDGSLSPAPVQTLLPGQAGQRIGGFRFPSDVSIDFSTPAPVEEDEGRQRGDEDDDHDDRHHGEVEIPDAAELVLRVNAPEDGVGIPRPDAANRNRYA